MKVKFEGLRQWRAQALKNSGGRGREIAFLLVQPDGENNITFDLHLHDANSDGARQERKVFMEAQENGVKIVSQTNHDNIVSATNYQRFKSDTAKYNGYYVNGVEVSCRLGGHPVECLVYGYDEAKAKVLIDSMKFPFLNRNFKIKRILELMQQRLDIANKMGILPKYLSINDFIAVEKTGEKGEIRYVPLSKVGLDANEDVCINRETLNEQVECEGEICKVNFDYFNAKLFKYIALCEKGRAYLLEKGIEVSEFDASKINIEHLEVPTMLKSAFAKFNRSMIQSNESDLYVDDSPLWPTFENVTTFARATGGVAILAHPFGYNSVKVEPIKLMDMAVEAGADGIECMHGYNTPEEVMLIYNYCKQRGLFITAGSDTHDYYSYQGNKTQIGIAPGVGEDYSQKDNPIHEMAISTHNLHYIGSGAYLKIKKKNTEECLGRENG